MSVMLIVLNALQLASAMTSSVAWRMSLMLAEPPVSELSTPLYQIQLTSVSRPSRSRRQSSSSSFR